MPLDHSLSPVFAYVADNPGHETPVHYLTQGSDVVVAHYIGPEMHDSAGYKKLGEIAPGKLQLQPIAASWIS